MNPIFRGRITQGKVVLDQPSHYLAQITKLEGKRIEQMLRVEKSQRSLNQNSYYWGVVLDILSKHTGYEIDELHEILKYKFLQVATSSEGKEPYQYVKSTTKLNTAEMEEYLDRIKRWAAMELSCVIPDPI